MQEKNGKSRYLIIGIVMLLCLGTVLLASCGKKSNSKEPVPEKPVTETGDINTVGDKITFGNYNGQMLNWYVCANADGKSLIVSEEAVAELPFFDVEDLDSVEWISSDWKVVGWQSSTIRTFLNDAFLNEAFNEAEKQCITETEITEYETTNDKVFILTLQDYSDYSSISLVYFHDNCWVLDPKGFKYRMQEDDLRIIEYNSHGPQMTQSIPLHKVNEECGVRPAMVVDTNLFKKATE